MYNDKRNYLISKEPFLIQSGYFNEFIDGIRNEEINGIDDILYFNYMESSDFEFGALPRSLKRITINSDFYQIYNIPKYRDKNGNCLKIYAPIIYIDNIKNMVDGLIQNKYSLKENCLLSEYVLKNNKNEKINNELKYNEFWWDIENDFFIFFKYPNKILTAVEAFKRRKLGYAMNKFQIAFTDKELLKLRRPFLNYRTAIKNYYCDLDNHIHFLEFDLYNSFLKILMDSFLIARTYKGEVCFNCNGFIFKINEDTLVSDVLKKYDISLEDYCFTASSIEDVIEEYQEEKLLQKRLVHTLSLIK